MKKFICIIICLVSGLTSSFAQKNKTTDSLWSLYKEAATDTAQIYALNKLADYYFRNQFIREADSVVKIQLRIAELTNSESLVLKVYFDNSASNIADWTSSQDYERVIKFIQKGIEYARRIEKTDYIALGYSRLATVLRKRGRYSEALDNSVLALNNMQEASDSIKAVVYIEIGNYYLTKKEFPTALTNYNNAFEIANKTKNPYLETDIYRCLAALNLELGQEGEGKDFLLRSVQLDKTNHYSEGLMKDYLTLARLDAEDYYINKAIAMADSLHVEEYKLKAKELMLAIYLSRQENEKALNYLDSQQELREFYLRGGIENYYYERGTIHLWTNSLDSALYYFKMVEPYMLAKYDSKIGSNIYLDMGDCYYKKKELSNAIEYYLKALAYFQQVGEINNVVTVSEGLSAFHKENNDFQKALYYKEFTAHVKDSLSQLTKAKEVALLDQDRQRKQATEEQRQKAAALDRKHNLQYMSITIAICLVFIGILVMGMFPISRFAIRLLGYFFFISVFEFIVLLLDNNIIHDLTHGEPLKIWLIKIGLIGMLVPIQHFLEHRITKFLESRQLLKARKSFSFKNLWSKKKELATEKANTGDDQAKPQ